MYGHYGKDLFTKVSAVKSISMTMHRALLWYKEKDWGANDNQHEEDEDHKYTPASKREVITLPHIFCASLHGLLGLVQAEIH